MIERCGLSADDSLRIEGDWLSLRPLSLRPSERFRLNVGFSDRGGVSPRLGTRGPGDQRHGMARDGAPDALVAPVALTLPSSTLRSLVWALLILVAWGLSLIATVRLPIDATWSSASWLLPLVLIRAFLQTGLFIVAHDAMHGSLLPGARCWNDRIGRLALALYAWLPWERCCRNHRLHHESPGGSGDPDHHDVHQPGLLRWYLRFMASYLSPSQMGALLSSWLLTLLLMGPQSPHCLSSLMLFWILPLLLSSLQLFVIGTYLPHRQSAARSGDRHHAASLAWPEVLSFLACFHFGYHWEHHADPQLPWHRLPAGRRLMTVQSWQRSTLALPLSSR